MQIDVRVDLKNAERYLQGLRKDQVPFATAYALTQTAKDAQSNIIKEMQRAFDRPKPYTLNGTYVKPATKRNLVALVKLKDGYLGDAGEQSKKGTPDKYLAAQVKGGARRPTGFERLLISQGMMPPGYYAVPTNFAPKDAFGNVPSGFYTRVMSQLEIGDEFQRKSRTKTRSSKPRNTTKASSPLEQAKRREARERRKAAQQLKPKVARRPRLPIFNVYPNRERNKHLKPGIYERVSNTSVKPIFIYVDRAPSYKPRLPFQRIVQDTIALRLRANFERGYALADATKR